MKTIKPAEAMTMPQLTKHVEQWHPRLAVASLKPHAADHQFTPDLEHIHSGEQPV